MRTWIAFILLSAAAMTQVGCFITGAHACTDEARSSLGVTVMGPSGPVCDANVVVQIGTENVALMPFSASNCSYGGIFERSGVMTVTASKAGFHQASKMVTVDSDECHVIMQSVTLTLTPE